MRKKSVNLPRDVDSPVLEFLTEFAQFLLAAGISSATFVYMSRVAFFTAASESAVLRNRRVNQSAVAAMTGLTRVQVRELAKQSGPTPGVLRDRVHNILEGWMTDASFLRADFTPRLLRQSGAISSFSQLVRKYGGDVTPRAMLEELLRKDRVSVHGKFVRLKAEAHKTRAEARLRQVAGAMAKLLKDSGSTAKSRYPLRSLSYEMEFPVASRKGGLLLQRRMAERLLHLLAELQAVGAAASLETPPAAGQKRKTTRARFALISEDLEENKSVTRDNPSKMARRRR
jgi:hypothetical protein